MGQWKNHMGGSEVVLSMVKENQSSEITISVERRTRFHGDVDYGCLNLSEKDWKRIGTEMGWLV